MTRKVRTILLWSTACGVALVFAASAYASSPGQSAYAGVGASQLSQVTGPTASTAATGAATASTASTGSLPFTGLDIGVVAAVGISLVGVGFVIRRTARTQKD